MDRQQIRINENLYNLLKTRVEENGGIYVKPILDAIISAYAKGRLTKYLTHIGIIKKSLQGKRIGVFIDKELKTKLSKKAVKQMLISKEIHSSYVIELLIEEYLLDRFSSIIDKEYNEILKERF